MTMFISCFLFFSLCCSGLWGCAAQKPTQPPPEVAIPLPPLPKPEPGLETASAAPELYFDPSPPEVTAQQILVGIEAMELPETGVCLFWNPRHQGGHSRNIFLLEKVGQQAQMFPMVIVAEDVPKARKAFESRSVPVFGKAGNIGWRMLCKPMELIQPKGQAILGQKPDLSRALRGFFV